MAERYPLSWPVGWKRTPSRARQRASFRTGRETSQVVNGQTHTSRSQQPVSVAVGIRRLRAELGRLGVLERDCIISTNMPTRLDGLPYSSSREPDDPGAAVYFRLKKQDRVLACDAWTRVADNLTAIAQHIDALRRIDRYGVGTLDQAFAGYAALPPKGGTWRGALGFGPDELVTGDMVERAFRVKARAAHPDVIGGSHEAMAAVNSARTEAYAELGVRMGAAS